MSTDARCEELLKKVIFRLSLTLLRLIVSLIQHIFGLCAPKQHKHPVTSI